MGAATARRLVDATGTALLAATLGVLAGAFKGQWKRLFKRPPLIITRPKARQCNKLRNHSSFANRRDVHELFSNFRGWPLVDTSARILGSSTRRSCVGGVKSEFSPRRSLRSECALLLRKGGVQFTSV